MKKNASSKNNKTLKSKKTLKLEKILPLTENQKLVFDNFSQKHLVLDGSAGVGKTFCALYLSLKELHHNKFDQIIICRSIVPTRDIGFLPGDMEEKIAVYETPYCEIVNDLYKDPTAYEFLKAEEKIKFVPTSFLRGLSFHNSIILIDELQSMNFHEISTIVTRIGKNSKLVACGDYIQSDLVKEKDKSSILDFIKIVKTLEEFEIVKFTENDIVRSDFVKNYIIAENKYFKRNLN